MQNHRVKDDGLWRQYFARCGVPRTCRCWANKPTPRGYFLSLHVTAGPWSTPVPYYCLHVRHSSNCVLLECGRAGPDWSSPTVYAPVFLSQHWLFISPPCSLGKIFRLIATFTPLRIVQETAKLCSRPTQLCCLWTWQSDGISFVETYLMSSDLLSPMTRDKEGHCCASGRVEWAERQSEWFLSTSRTD